MEWTDESEDNVVTNSHSCYFDFAVSPNQPTCWPLSTSQSIQIKSIFSHHGIHSAFSTRAKRRLQTVRHSGGRFLRKWMLLLRCVVLSMSSLRASCSMVFCWIVLSFLWSQSSARCLCLVVCCYVTKCVTLYMQSLTFLIVTSHVLVCSRCCK